MTKKIISLALALIMALGLFSATALAAEPKLTIDKTAYSAGETITVTYSDVAKTSTKSWIAVAPAGGTADKYLDYKNAVENSGTLQLTAPTANGTFDVRLYQGSRADEANLVRSAAVTFTVSDGTHPYNEPTLKLDKSDYSAGEVISVTYYDVAKTSLKSWIAVAPAGGAADKYLDWKYANDNSGTLQLTAPTENGTFEVRLYQGSRAEEANLVRSSAVTFTVGGASQPQPPVTTQPTQPTQPTPPAQPTQPTQPTQPSPSLTATAVGSGVKLEWSPLSGVLGYRVYRSTTAGTEGISITDFPVTGSPFVDVNVDASTTYYYSLRAVLKEASATTGEREQLSSPSAQINMKTGATILGGNASDSGGKTKSVILMKLNDGMMSVNGIGQEIDPGRGTAPQVLNGRTIVPIRAIIEAMGGKLGWEDATGKITLEANGHSVTMWLNQKDLIVDGNNQAMDVAPVSINGRTMVPVRFAAENLGCVVDWIASTGEIVIVYYTGGTPTLALQPTKPAEPTQPVTPPVTTEPPVTTTPPVTQPTTPQVTTEPTKPSEPPSGSSKEITGTWCYGNVGGGFYTEWSAGGNMINQKWNNLGSFVEIHQFNADGTYSSITYSDFTMQYTRYNSFIYTKGNWSILAPGTICITNFVESKDDLVTLSNSFKDRSGNDKYLYYQLTAKDGVNGAFIENEPVEDAITKHFYEKYDISGDPAASTEPPATTEPTNGNIDPQLIGHWRYYHSRQAYYYFEADGTFRYLEFSGSSSYQTAEGKYYTSEGKIYFSEIQYEKGTQHERTFVDRVHEYTFGTTSDGERCLMIRMMWFNDSSEATYMDLSKADEFIWRD